MQILAPVLARDGRLPEPLRAGIAPPTERGARRLGRAAAGRGDARRGRREPRRRRARRRSSTSARSPSPRSTSTGSRAARRMLQKTVLPVVAEANVSIRLAPGPGRRTRSAPRVERLLREAAPGGRGARGRSPLVGRAPGSVPPDAPAIQLGHDAFERALGAPPLLVRSGGTLPIVPALVGQGHPDDRHRLRPARGQHPLAERAAAGRVPPARRSRRRRSSTAPRRR